MKLEQRYESPTVTALRSLEATRLADGRVELVLDEATKKHTGERWSRRTIPITLTAEQFRQLCAS